MKSLLRTLLIIGLSATSLPAKAQTPDFPASTLTFVVPLAAGGPADALARVLGEQLSRKLQRTIVIENRVGAGGDIGAAYVAHSPANGSIWLFTVDSVLTTNPHINATKTYKTSELTGDAKVGSVALVLAVNPRGVSAKSFQELVELSKQSSLSFGSAGNGSPGHLAFEYLRTVTPLVGVHVPYRGAAPVVTDLLGGNINAAFIVAGAVAPHVKEGALRALAVSTSKRLPWLPETPSAEEAGIKGFDARFANLLLAPSSTPAPLLERMEKAVLEIAEDPEFRKKLEAISTDADFGGRDAANSWIDQESKRWSKVVDEAGLKAKN